MPFLLASLFLLTLVAALALLVLARLLRERSGVPIHARIVYSDTGAWKRPERPLFSRTYVLTGKPDYIVEERGTLIPVEVKPNRAASEPRESDVMQLTAYGLLIQETYGTLPPYGLLKYRDAVFRVDFTPALTSRLVDLMDAMRQDQQARDVARNHAEPWRCHACGYAATRGGEDACGQALE